METVEPADNDGMPRRQAPCSCADCSPEGEEPPPPTLREADVEAVVAALHERDTEHAA